MDLELLHTPGIGIENLEFDTRRMPDQFTARRNASEHRENEATDAVDIRLLIVGNELHAQVPLELFDRRPCDRDNAELRVQNDVGFLVLIVFVFDVADDLLDQIFDRD